MAIIRKSKGRVIQHDQQRVFVSFQKDAIEAKDKVIAELHSFETDIDCVVSCLDDPIGHGIDAEALELELLETKVLILIVSKELIASVRTNQLPEEFVIAKRVGIQILPIALYPELFRDFPLLMGAVHGISLADAGFHVKLRDQMENLLASTELIREVTEKAFNAQLFLSYRKKDLAEAKRFMHAFHRNPQFMSIAIWYDNFLTAGRFFDSEIRASIDASDAFIVLGTPNIIEKGNYVLREEYPYAKKCRKKIITVTTESAPVRKIKRHFRSSQGIVSISDEAQMKKQFHQILHDKSIEHIRIDQLYLLGMAYLKGIMVEKNIPIAINTLKAVASVDDPSGFKAAEQLAALYEQGIAVDMDHEEATKWHGRTVEICQHLYGENDKRTLIPMIRIVQSIQNRGDYRTAYTLYSHAVEFFEAAFGPESHETSAIYTSLANICTTLDKTGEALHWGEKALAVHRKLDDEDTLDIAATYDSLAYALCERGNTPAALERYNKALTIRENILGEDHPATASSYIKLGELLLKSDHIRAKHLFEKALHTVERIYGGSHVKTADIYNDLGLVFQAEGNVDKATDMFKKALPIMENSLGAKHPNTQIVRLNLEKLQKTAKSADDANTIDMFKHELLTRDDYPLEGESGFNQCYQGDYLSSRLNAINDEEFILFLVSHAESPTVRKKANEWLLYEGTYTRRLL